MWPWKKKQKTKRDTHPQTEADRIRREREQREIRNFWRYTGDKQEPVDDRQL